ncbi:FAD-dependent oxidoreductase [Rubellicoccus peritrichatus]|uniref:FAD-dependent oxidoreductase n=1 Tax=Rubellicoccus peritrichatus TaxID=3080537 RepID=A0AAQ3QY10_9BACT|nr:FAD-dependent oxidoreductase [Puniceicoccus sp. CR14]WOO43607.1 FAD-dependent oxidoreductase [Puniceicoccus sp. CR14]
MKSKNEYSADVAIIGGGFGAVAATRALMDQGLKVVLTDEFEWIGGQATSQALCVMDEFYDPVGETQMNARYADFRERLRNYYRDNFKLSPLGESQLHFCAGNAACAPVTAESHVAHRVITELFESAVASGQLTILTRTKPIAAERSEDRVISVDCRCLDVPDEIVRLKANFFLDGTETGDTYPLLGLDYGLGEESKETFGETHAPVQANREAVQSYTYCIAVEFVPGGDFTIEKPEGYEELRDKQPFSYGNLGAKADQPGKFFELEFSHETGDRIVPFWYYRCLVDVRNFDDPVLTTSRAVINVSSNDYRGDGFVDNPNGEEALAEARQLSLAYLYWLQTEAPRDDGGFGYPEIRPMPEATGTSDGIAQAPYVREGRRLRACEVVVEEDLSTEFHSTARARIFPNSVGLGAYMIDIHHRSAGGGGMVQMTRPYQIPLGALVSPELTNFAVANKGIGVTQISNGAYRLHNLEWATGEAAGELAAFCLERCPDHPNLKGDDLFAYQRRLLQAGIPLYWYEDLSIDHPAFEAAQILALTGVWPGDPRHLRIEVPQSCCRHRPMMLNVLKRLKEAGSDLNLLRDINTINHGSRKVDLMHQMVNMMDRIGWPKAAIDRKWKRFDDSDHDVQDPAKLW